VAAQQTLDFAKEAKSCGRATKKCIWKRLFLFNTFAKKEAKKGAIE